MSLASISDNEALAAFCADAGYDLSKAIVRTAIFVDPAAQGQGISKLLEADLFDYTRSEGYSFVVDLGFATDEITSWCKSHADVIDTGILDASGCLISIREF